MELIGFHDNKKNISALSDWWRGTRRVDVWLTLAWFDILLRYRRSALGPWWLTISMGAMIAGMGPLYATLFGTELSKFFPHLTLGIIFWTLFTSISQDSSATFINSANYIKQGDFPVILFVWRTLSRCFIQFAHHIVLYIPVAFYVKIDISLSSFLFIPAFLLFFLNAHFVSISLGIVCARFRDVAQIVTSLMQLLMFLTPVFWMPSSLPDRAKYMLWNPLAQMLDILRTPLMGGVASLESWSGVIIWSVINITLACYLFKRYRRRIVFWI